MVPSLLPTSPGNFLLWYQGHIAIIRAHYTVARPATKRFHTSDWRPLQTSCRPWTWWCKTRRPRWLREHDDDDDDYIDAAYCYKCLMLCGPFVRVFGWHTRELYKMDKPIEQPFRGTDSCEKHALTPPGKHDYTIRARRRCGLT